MKKLLLAGVSASALALVSGAAMAQSSSTATIDGDLFGAVSDGVAGNVVVDIGVSERFNTIDGTSYSGVSGVHSIQQNNGSANRMLSAMSVQIDIDPVGTPDVDTVASVTGRVSNNDVTRDDSDPDTDVDRRNSILDDAFSSQAGVVTVQQNNGDANDIGAATAVHTSIDEIDDLFQEAAVQARIDGNNTDGGALTDTGVTSVNEISDGGAAGITGPFQGFAGVVNVQQNNGTVNAMGIANAIAGVVGDVDEVSQDAFAQNEPFGVFDQDVVDQGADRSNSIIDAFNGAAAGMATVQQNNGDANIIAAANAVLGLLTPSSSIDDTDDILQEALAGDLFVVVDNIDSTTSNADRSNLIDPSFTGGAGIFNVQQNNGNANVMAIANAVVGVVATGDDAEDLTQNAEAGGQILEVDVDVNGGTFDNTIDGSFNSAIGWMNVQQNNGDANVITQATAVAGLGGSVSGPGSNDIIQSASFTGSINEEPGADPSVLVTDSNSDRDNLINNSFQSASGLVNVQQNNGNANTIGAANAVAGANDLLVDDLIQTVDVNGTIDSDGFIIDRVVDVTEIGGERTNEIDNSFTGDGFNGVATVQQNNGDGNVIGAATAVVGEAPIFGEPSGPDDITQTVTANGLLIGEGDPAVAVDVTNSDLDNEIVDDAFDDSNGIFTIQQNNGNGNVMGSATAVAAVFDLLDPFATSTVSQTVRAGGDVRDFQTTDTDSHRDNLIENSLDRIDGAVTVQQNNGNANVMSTALGFVVSTEQDFFSSSAVSQTVSADGDIANNANTSDDVFDNGSDRTNEIDNAFNNSDGVFNVQQNNGDANVLASAMGVLVNDGDGEFEAFSQTVSTTGTVGNVDDAFDFRNGVENGERLNLIEDETGSDQGVGEDSNMWATFQQNNGSGNAILASSAVAVQLNSPGIQVSPLTDAVTSQTVSTSGLVDGVETNVEDQAAIGDATRDRTNTITDDSFEDAEGAVTVQQNNGDANVLGAAIGILASDGSDDIDAVVTQDVSALGTVSDSGTTGAFFPDGINDVSSNRENTINDDSFDDYRGIFNVQQNNGSVNVLGSSIGVVASINPDEVNGDGVANSTTVIGNVTDNRVTVGVASPAPFPGGAGSPGYSDRDNVIDNAFNDVEGVGTVIQNNGDVNVIGSAIAVAAHDGGPTGFGNAVSSAALGGVVSNNQVTVFSAGPNGTQFDNTISNSFQNLSGVTTVIQNNGSANVIGSAVTVTANF